MTSVKTSEPVFFAGTFATGDTVSHRFSIINEGKEDLAIDTVTTSCDCIKSSWKRKGTIPGDTAFLTVSFIVSPSDIGEQVKTALVSANVANAFIPFRIRYFVRNNIK
ncbi:DUF1573 domain-containing protein [Hufsiella ginkgonis]|uniref:DUF1573 domain-containing protein n=1 Tax=Hufsiella ginkgonis TaxID=2695274 RepID=A0A7K1XZS6_9SPHI|nr:DUF1573 domain-containing protein [Hufsiella ginkgonis]